eukprot:scaffold44792_cov34-Cyclotella_meneghiniana.AAC.1
MKRGAKGTTRSESKADTEGVETVVFGGAPPSPLNLPESPDILASSQGPSVTQHLLKRIQKSIKGSQSFFGVAVDVVT